MNSIKRSAGAIAAIVVVGILASNWRAVRTWRSFRFDARSPTLLIDDARFYYLRLDAVSAITEKGGVATVSGSRLGWFDFDGRRSVLVSVSRRLSQEATQSSDATSEWNVTGSETVRHVPSGASIQFEPMGWRAPKALVARRLSAGVHMLLLADGDWKVGPDAYLAVVVVRGPELETKVSKD